MIPTTIRALRAAFVSAIKGISPTEENAAKWHYTPRADDVPGAAMRTFAVQVAAPEADEGDDAVYGGGISYTATLHVLVSYAHLAEDREEEVVAADATDLWSALLGVTDPGLIDVESPDTVAEIEDRGGALLVTYQFPVRYFAKGP